MSATIVKGTTFVSTATAGGMHALVESATISGIDRTCLRASEISVATLQAAPPSSPSDREVWQTATNNYLGAYETANTRWRGTLPQIVPYTLNVSSADVEAGSALMPSGAVTATLTSLDLTVTTGTSDKVIAIALGSCTAGNKSLCVISGPVKAKVTGTVSAGQAVKPSSTAGTLQAVAIGVGAGWEVCGVANSAGSGGLAWITLRR